MQRQLRKHHAELHARAAALQSIADATPALGIVAAVLGVVKTMASINQPVEVLGEMIGGALVGTFLGVFLAYGFIGPIAAKMNQTYEEDAQFYAIIRDCLVGLPAGSLGADRGRARPRQRADHAAAELPGHGRGAERAAGRSRWPPDRMSREPRPIIIRRPIVSGGHGAPWRCLEGRLRRLRHRDDGLLPAALADQQRQRRDQARAWPSSSATPRSISVRPAVSAACSTA